MWLKIPLVAALAFSFLLTPLPGAGYEKLPDNHDCFKTRRGGYKCVRGPLAGKTFKSEKEMVRALTRGFGPMENQRSTVSKSKKRVKKAKRIKKAKQKSKKKARKAIKKRRRR